MLDLLDTRFHDNRSWRNQRAGDLGGRSPAAKPASEQNDHGQPEDQVSPDRIAGFLCLCRRHDLTTPPSDTILIGEGAATRDCNTWPSTVSFGPKACIRPSF